MAVSTADRAVKRTGAWGRFTMRTDAWWVEPLVFGLFLGAFIVYSTWRAFENAHYFVGPYHSPLGSPDLRELLHLQNVPAWISPSMLILPFPILFRMTCYYYRKAYYRSYMASPPGCAVKGLSGYGYVGERGVFTLQNLHRYALYTAIVILAWLWYDAFLAVGVPQGAPFLSMGSFVFFGNVLLLSAYTLGCHSLRHIVGGKLDCFSCDPGARMRYGLWQKVTVLNGRHMLWAWCSLASIWLVDLYVRGVSAGWFGEGRLL